MYYSLVPWSTDEIPAAPPKSWHNAIPFKAEDAADGEDEVVSGAILKNVHTGEEVTAEASAVFVAIGRTLSTSFLEDLVEFNPVLAGVEHGTLVLGYSQVAMFPTAITSVGSGAAAALDAERWLDEKGLGNEEAEFEAQLLVEPMADGGGGRRQGGDSDSYNVHEDADRRMLGRKRVWLPS
ncbi:hypothetical protein ACHAXR_005735 [Thalassiosira sp. AJA248-18]